MGEWILLAVGTLFFYACIHGILYLVRLRRRGMIRRRDYRDPQGRFSLHYPAEWEIVERKGKLLFLTHDHDGRLEIVILPRISGEPPPKEFLQAKIAVSGIQLDEPAIHEFRIPAGPGACLESRATQDFERLYLQEWVVDAGDLRILLSYRCSVLYGLVDGYYIDQLVKSISL